jgi:hypothetical protein
MRSLNIQFHMLFEELTEFVRDVSSRYHLDVELERFYPKAARLVPSGADLSEEIRQFGQVDRFWLLCKTPDSPTTERFMLDVGRQRGDRLAQGDLAGGARTDQAYRILKQVAAELKRRTTAGIWLVTEAGNVGYIKKDRISERAANASRAGEIDLVGVGFTCSYHVDQPEIEES